MIKAMTFFLTVMAGLAAVAVGQEVLAHASFDEEEEAAAPGSPAPEATVLNRSAPLVAPPVPEPRDDQDGLPAKEEARLGTNPHAADSDGDGYADDVEVRRGYNPLIASPRDKIDFSRLRFEHLAPSTQLAVTDVRLELKVGEEAVVVTGAGPAETLVTLLVYSEVPQVVIESTDITGRFRMVLPAMPALGEHRVVAAVTDAAGQPTMVSRPFSFTRTAEAIVVPPITTSAAVEEQSSSSASRPRVWQWFSRVAAFVRGLIQRLV